MADNESLPNGINKWMQEEVEQSQKAAVKEYERLEKRLEEIKYRVQMLNTTLRCQHEIEDEEGSFLVINSKCKHCGYSWSV